MLMKKIYTMIWMLGVSVATMAQGWPEKYDGVMLQGFYWDSYVDTQWTNLESQADELSQYFNLIWIPNSGKTESFYNNKNQTMGYDPCFWLDHTSWFGTEDQLRSMINTFKAKGTGIIEDVVINHKNGLGSWVYFPNETKGTYKIEWDNTNYSGICKTDECNKNGYPTTGANDTGTDFNGFRDLDHTNATVQQNVKTYLKFLLNDLGYAGFRYDMVKGYAASYTALYNADANPTYSVGENMDGSKATVAKWLNDTKLDGKIMSAAFDFPLKYYINDAFKNGGNWSRLNDGALADDVNYARYAVTFVDNHDTGRTDGGDGSAPLVANVESANAYILTMPGTPCVWLSHWKAHKVAIKKQILVRKAAGIHNQSTIQTKTASTNGYILNVQGTKGNVLLLLGGATTSTDGYKLALEGTNYKMYVSNSVDISALDNVKEDTFTAPDFCVVNDGEVCAFFEAPSSWTNVHCYTWKGSTEYCGSWPGASCTKVGTNNGNNVWKWTYSGSLTTQPSNIIFNVGSDSKKTTDLDFKNGGYYNEAGAIQGVVTDIEAVRTTPSVQNTAIYDLQGRRIQGEPTRKGLYIINGKKVVR